MARRTAEELIGANPVSRGMPSLVARKASGVEAESRNETAVKVGRVLRGLLNDLKRRPEDAARELDVSLEAIERILAGRDDLPADLLEKACRIWPLNPRDFAAVIDDAPSGVQVMRAEQSARSRRVMVRGGRPYYEYRDTACSRVSSFRPEWIKQLQVVEDNDPHNPRVAWNSGHFMHQFTYFIGPVNFYYYNERGEKAVAVMNTGDSMYICPFVPHSFTTRANQRGEHGLILALTYGNNLAGDAQHELNAISGELARGYCLDGATPAAMTGALIRYYMGCLSLTEEELARRAGVRRARISQLLAGVPAERDYGLLEAIADALNVGLREILGHDGGVRRVVTAQGPGERWCRQGHGYHYEFRELASSELVPLAKSLEMRIQADERPFAAQHCIGLHQYLYNLGDKAVTLRWQCGEQVLRDQIGPGDSVFVKPFVKHDYVAVDGHLLSLRIQSKMSGDCMRELSYIGARHIDRIVAEDRQWFKAAGASR